MGRCQRLDVSSILTIRTRIWKTYGIGEPRSFERCLIIERWFVGSNPTSSEFMGS